MKDIFVVQGTPTDYEVDYDIYAVCVTREIAERELAKAIERDTEHEFDYEIVIWNLLTE